MAIGSAVVHVNSGAAAASFTSASFTPTANAVIFAYLSARTSSAAIPTITDTGPNGWTLVSGTNLSVGAGNLKTALYVWNSGGSPSAMTATVNSAAALACSMLIAAFPGGTLKSSNVGIAQDTAGDPAPTLPSTPAGTSMAVAFNSQNAGAAPTASPAAQGYTSVVNGAPATNLRHTLFTMAGAPGTPAAGNPSWVSTGTDALGIVLELTDVEGFWPVVTDTVATVAPAGNTSHTVTLPTGLGVGDMCLIQGTLDVVVTTFGWPSGWTALIALTNLPGTHVAYRICDGTEGSTITVTTAATATNGPAFIAHRITGAHATQTPEYGTTIVTAGSSTTDPPGVTPSWGLSNGLWYTSSCIVSAGNPTQPSGYTHHSAFTAGNGNSISTCSLQATATSRDPGVFTYAGTTNKRSLTIAIRPLASIPAVTGTIAQTSPSATQAAIGGCVPIGTQAFQRGAFQVTPAFQLTGAAVTGTIAQTIGSSAQAASGTVTAPPAVTGTIVQTITRAAQALSGTVTVAGAVSGTIAQTLSPAQQSASGTVTAAAAVTGTIAQTITHAGQAASGTVQDNITGTIAQTITRAAQALAGTVTAAPAVTGTIAQTTAASSQAATGTVTAAGAIGGVIAQTISPASQALAGTVTAAPAVTGTIVQTLRPASQAATGTVAVAGAIIGTIAQTLSPAFQAALGTVSGGIQPPDGRPVGGFAGWSEAEEQAQRTYRRLKRKAEVELRELLEAQIRGEEYPPAQAEQVLAELMAFPALPVEMPFMPDLAGLRAQLALLEQALRQGLAEQELRQQVALQALLQEEMAIVALLA